MSIMQMYASCKNLFLIFKCYFYNFGLQNVKILCGLRTKNAVCVNAVGVHAVHGHTADAGDADGHAAGVRAAGARALFIHAVGKPSAGAPAVGVRVSGLRILSGYAVVVRTIVYISTVYLLCCRFPYCT